MRYGGITGYDRPVTPGECSMVDDICVDRVLGDLCVESDNGFVVAIGEGYKAMKKIGNKRDKPYMKRTESMQEKRINEIMGIKNGYQPEGKGLDRRNPPRGNMTIEDVIRTKMAQMKKLVKEHPGISVRAFVQTAPGEVTELRAK